MSDGVIPLLLKDLGEGPVPWEFRAQVGEQSSACQGGGCPAESGGFCAASF